MVQRFVRSDAAAKTAISAFEVAIKRTDADVAAGWESSIEDLAKLGAISVEQLQGLEKFAKTATKVSA